MEKECLTRVPGHFLTGEIAVAVSDKPRQFCLHNPTAVVREQDVNTRTISAPFSNRSSSFSCGEAAVDRSENHVTEGQVKVDDVLFDEASALLESSDVDNNVSRAVTLLERAVQEYSHVPSMVVLGILLQDSEDSVQDDLSKAVSLFERAVREGNDVMALKRLAIFLLRGGEGREPDHDRILDTFEFALDSVVSNEAVSVLCWILQCAETGLDWNVERVVALLAKGVEACNNRDIIFRVAYLYQVGSPVVPADGKRAVDLYRDLVMEHEDVIAMNNLGLLLFRGDDVERDTKYAAELFERAIENGSIGQNSVQVPEDCEKYVILDGVADENERPHIMAMLNLADLLRKGSEHVPPDIPRAIELLERVISEGHTKRAKAMKMLSKILKDRSKNEKSADMGNANALLEQAVDECGDVESMCELALLLANGWDGVDMDVKRAVTLFETVVAVSDDSSKAGFALNHLAGIFEEGRGDVEKDAKRAVELYELSMATENSVIPVANLAALLCRGEEGIERDLNRAAELYQYAVDEWSDKFAMYELSMMLLDGPDDIEPDEERGLELLERLVDAGGILGAYHQLARILTKGLYGVAIDVNRAIELYEKAIAENFSPSMNNLACILRFGTGGVKKDIKRAMELLDRAIFDHGNTDAMFNLASILEEGDEGVEPDLMRAIALYERVAVEADDDEAMDKVHFIFQNMHR